ncbi:hypothetical protein T08_7185 [Trichinella sp. T8]|nr:hypothetical protein T08_7185 [Trichinella sp. T8]
MNYRNFLEDLHLYLWHGKHVPPSRLDISQIQNGYNKAFVVFIYFTTEDIVDGATSDMSVEEEFKWSVEFSSDKVVISKTFVEHSVTVLTVLLSGEISFSDVSLNFVRCHEYVLIQLKEPLIDLQTATCFDEQRCQLTVSLPLPAGLFHAAQSKFFKWPLLKSPRLHVIDLIIIVFLWLLPVLEYFPEKIVCYRGLHISQLLL